MRTRITPGIGVVVLAALLVAGAAGRAGASDGCNNASLRGAYAFRVDGHSATNPFLAPGPFAAIGKNTYDGHGGMTGSIVISTNGTILKRSYTGTYKVKSDCTGVKSATLEDGPTVAFDFVISANLREIQMIATGVGIAAPLPAGITISGAARKLFTDPWDRR